MKIRDRAQVDVACQWCGKHLKGREHILMLYWVRYHRAPDGSRCAGGRGIWHHVPLDPAEAERQRVLLAEIEAKYGGAA